MQDNSFEGLRAKFKSQINSAIKAPISNLIGQLGPLPLDKKSNIVQRRHLADKLLIDLGETKLLDDIHPELIPIELAGDNHGRDLITRLISDKAGNTDELLMVEIGSFLGGSALRWAKVSPKCRVIAIDPWANDHTDYLKNIFTDPSKQSMLSNLSEKDFLAALHYLKKNGSLGFAKQVTYNYPNISLVRSQSPAFLLSLYFRQVYPDIIYFDSDKQCHDIELAISIFPGSTICGDDYLWLDDNRVNPIKNFLNSRVKNFHNLVTSNGQSWILSD